MRVNDPALPRLHTPLPLIIIPYLGTLVFTTWLPGIHIMPCPATLPWVVECQLMPLRQMRITQPIISTVEEEQTPPLPIWAAVVTLVVVVADSIQPRTTNTHSTTLQSNNPSA